MKIVILDGYALNPGDLSWDKFKQLGDLAVYDRTPADLILERIGDAEVIYTNKTQLTRETFEKAPNIKFVGVLATGYNVVDVEAAKEKGILVANVPAYSTSAVAQMTFALLLEICNHVWKHSEEVKNGVWAASTDFCFWNYPLIELAGKTIGIIGLGRIGEAVSKIAQAFGMKVLAYSPHPKRELETEMMKYVELDELFQKADVISLHCPLFESTRGIINRDTIARMKDGVIIINTSRGPLIAEKDLAEALNSGKVAGAAVDVLSSEPPERDNILVNAKNSIITPHIAWAPLETRIRLLNIAADNLKQFLTGTPVNIVNR